MDTNQTLAHLAAELAEQREGKVRAERAAIEWKQRYEEMHDAVHHVEQANAEYSVALDRQRGEIEALEEEVRELKALTAGEETEEVNHGSVECNVNGTTATARAAGGG
jgi:predicted RNase H-like nuclease (RuvC/YqgF family)